MAVRDRDYYLSKTNQGRYGAKDSRRAQFGNHHSFARRPESSGNGKQLILLLLLLVVLYQVGSDKLQRRAQSAQSRAPEATEQLEAQISPEQEVELIPGGLVIKADASGHFRGKMLINDVQMPFLIDTGATQTAIPEQMAINADLPVGREIQTNTAGGQVSNQLTRMASMKLGNAELKNLQAIISPHLTEVLVGMNTLKYFRMTQDKDTLTLVVANGVETVETLEKDLPLQMPPPHFKADEAGEASDSPQENMPVKTRKSWKKSMVCDGNQHCSPSYGYR